MLDISACLNRTRYAAKDARKAALSTKYIGRGSDRSSTNAYRIAIGKARANTGSYSSDDVVWISAEGARVGRLAPDFVEIALACAARATFITDDAANRKRSYNVGDREVSAQLRLSGYRELTPGRWTPPPETGER